MLAYEEKEAPLVSLSVSLLMLYEQNFPKQVINSGVGVVVDG
jgi:hypothetical protein